MYPKLVRDFTRKQRVLLAIIPPLAALLIRALGATLRYRDINAPGVPVGITIPGPVVFAFWHRCLLTCAHRFRNKGIAILISPSFDGELIARTVEYLGFLPVRGSSLARRRRSACAAWPRPTTPAIAAPSPPTALAAPTWSPNPGLCSSPSL